MLTEVISKLDLAVLELALIDAFYDMCFYEGEELINNLDDYLTNVSNGTNTEEQNIAFFETAFPYIKNSVMAYSSTITESEQKEIVAGSDLNELKRIKPGAVGVDSLRQMHNKNRTLANKTISESEEFEIWKSVGQMLVESAIIGSNKAKSILESSTAKKITDATMGGVAANILPGSLTGPKFYKPSGKSVNPSENK